MADKIQFSVSATPIEDVGASQQGGASNFIASSEAGGSIGSSGENTISSFDGSGGATHGYQNGSKYYGSAAVDVLGALSLSAPDFVIVKHTGFEGLAGTTAGATANTADILQVAVSDGTSAVTAGYLASGQSMVLPLRGKANHVVQVRSLNADLSSDGANTIQVEYLAAT